VANPLALSGLARSDREYEIEEWLDERGVADGWSYAPTLASLGYDNRMLAELLGQFEVRQLTAILAWVKESYTTYNLLNEIGQGTSRISEIVNALKTYTYLDQAPIQSVNVNQGLDNTLALMQNKLKPGVTVCRDYDPDLPRIEAYGSELNQVWTNIIDNALYAVEDEGEITLKTYQDGRWLVVEISDNGTGITADIQGQIFDPFFTTKPPGSGSGLGLNISHNIITQKHDGVITVDSQPGFTCFQVKLPVK
jgi:signal transduction histidine kinase